MTPSPDDLARIAAACGFRGTPRFTPLPGFSATITGIVRAGTRSCFVKIATDPRGGRKLTVERAVLVALDGCHAPRVLAALSLEAGPALVLEDLSEAHWPLPYPSAAGRLLAVALERVAGVEPPGEVQAPRWRTGRWAALASRVDALAELGIASGAWWEGAIPRLAEAEEAAPLAGEALCHADLWRANIAFAGTGPRGGGRVGRTVFVDFGDAVRANPDLDRAMAALLLVGAGLDPAPVVPPRMGEWAALLAGGTALAATAPAPRWAADGASLRAGQREALARAIPYIAATLRIARPR